MKKTPFYVHVVTLFPEMFPGPLSASIMGRAHANGLWQMTTTNIRDFALDKHKTVDDTPYGGGAGMLMRPDVVANAVRHARTQTPDAKVVFLTPSGKRFTQEKARELSQGSGVILLCGHYEGIDQRAIDAEVDEELSIGDYVLSGGEMAAMIMTDAIVRTLPETLGNSETLHEESFDIESDKGEKFLEYPHYTRPAVWEGKEVPPVLLSGHHANIEAWRKEKSREKTEKNRPDLLVQ